MKILLSIMSVFALVLSAMAQGGKYSSYPNTSTLQSGDLFLVARSGVNNYNVTAAQMPGALFLQPTNENLTAWGLFTPTVFSNGVFTAIAAGDATERAFAVGASNSVLNQATNFAVTATNNFRDGSRLTNLLHSSTVSGVSGVSVALTQNSDGSTNYGLTVTAGGSGTVTSVDVAKSGHTSSGAVTGAGTITLTRTGPEDLLGFPLTNGSYFSFTGDSTNGGKLKVGGNQTNAGTLWVHGNQTNDGNLKVVGTITGNGSGITSLNGGNMTAGSLSSNALDGGSLAQLFAFSTGADGSGLVNLTAANLTGTIPHGSLLSFILTNQWQGPLEIDGAQTNASSLWVHGNQTNDALLKVVGNQTNVGNVSVSGVLTNFGGVVQKAGVTNETLTASTDLEADANKKIVSLANGTGVKTNNGSGAVGWSRIPQLDLGASTNFADTNIVISTNNWNWPGPTNNIDFARGTFQRYRPADTTGVNITNVLNFPVGQVGPVVFRIENTNLTALNVKLPATCSTTNSLGGLTVSVNASNQLQILISVDPTQTNALFSDQQLIK